MKNNLFTYLPKENFLSLFGPAEKTLQAFCPHPTLPPRVQAERMIRACCRLGDCFNLQTLSKFDERERGVRPTAR